MTGDGTANPLGCLSSRSDWEFEKRRELTPLSDSSEAYVLPDAILRRIPPAAPSTRGLRAFAPDPDTCEESDELCTPTQ